MPANACKADGCVAACPSWRVRMRPAGPAMDEVVDAELGDCSSARPQTNARRTPNTALASACCCPARHTCYCRNVCGALASASVHEVVVVAAAVVEQAASTCAVWTLGRRLGQCVAHAARASLAHPEPRPGAPAAKHTKARVAGILSASHYSNYSGPQECAPFEGAKHLV